MIHNCPVCGIEHDVDDQAPVAEVLEAEAVVAVAEIEANRDITLAKINAAATDQDAELTLAHLRGRLDGIEETLARMTPPEPDPEPVPVVVEPAPEPGPVVDPVVDAPPIVEPAGRTKKRTNPFWG